MTTEIADRTKLALKAANLYYVRELKMETIAERLHVSRSSVSRLLTFARRTGLVDIRIRQSADDLPRLQHILRMRDGITAYIIPTAASLSPQERATQVSRHAGRIIPWMIERNMVVGVAWGTTIAGVARHLQSRPLVDVTVVQLNGAAHPENAGIGFAGEILDRFADALSGRVEPLPVPAFFDDPATRGALWRERSIARIRALHSTMDVVVFGIGDPNSGIPGHVYRGGYLDESDHADMVVDGVAGDVATVFFRADGSHDGIRLNARSSGPELESLRTTPRRICVVSDPSRLTALQGALAAHLVTDLIIDEQSARELAGTYVQGL